MRIITFVIYCSPSPCDIILVCRTLSKKLSKSLLSWICDNYFPAPPDSEEMILLNRIMGINDAERIRKIIKGHFGSRLLYIYEVNCLPGR